MHWNDVLNNPYLHDLPFKIELDKWGKILMTPASNQHGALQAKIGMQLQRDKKSGVVISECSVQTPEGVRVADVAWCSDEFILTHGYTTPYAVAPEICVEIKSPGNSAREMEEKTALYLQQGAHEVWIAELDGGIERFYSATLTRGNHTSSGGVGK